MVLEKKSIHRKNMGKMKRFIASRLQELSFGQNMMSKVFAALNMATLLIVASMKWGFKLDRWIVVIVVTAIFMMWLVGWICEVTGIRKAYRESEFKDVYWTKTKE